MCLLLRLACCLAIFAAADIDTGDAGCPGKVCSVIGVISAGVLVGRGGFVALESSASALDSVLVTVRKVPFDSRSDLACCVTYTIRLAFLSYAHGREPDLLVCTNCIARLTEYSRLTSNIEVNFSQRMWRRRRGQRVEFRVGIAQVARSLDSERRETRSTRSCGGSGHDGGLSGWAE